jgi:hypothetical protein
MAALPSRTQPGLVNCNKTETKALEQIQALSAIKEIDRIETAISEHQTDQSEGY